MARFEAETQYRGYILRLDVSETNVETENNRSKVAWALYIVNGYKNGIYYRFNANFTFSATINGTTVVSYSGNVNTTDVGSREAHKLASGTTDWIGHNTDGSKTVSCSASCSGGAGYGPGTGSCSGNLTLTKIDRYPMLTDAPNFNDEANPTIQYTTSLGFTGASVKACIASADGSTIYAGYRDVVVSDGSYTFNLTTTERNNLRNATPNSNTLNIRFYIKTTTTGGTEYYSYLDRQLSIVNANPTISNTETETDTNVITYLGTGASTVVQNASKVQCEVTATPQKGSSVSSVTITHNSIVYPTTLSSGKYVATIPISANSFQINVTDSRGNAATKTVTKTMITYSPVDFTSFTIKRVNSTSSTIRFNLEARYYQVTLGSTANTPRLYYKLDNGNYVEIPKKDTTVSPQIDGYEIDAANHKVTLTNYDVSNLLVYTSAGQITLYIEDLLTNDTDGGTNGYVTKGVPTFEAGEHEFQVNGTLYVADENRENAGEVYSNVYSTSETVVGKWIDDNLIYRKVFQTGALSSGNLTINHGISNLNTVIKAYGFGKNTFNGAVTQYPIVKVATGDINNQLGIDVTATQLTILKGNNVSMNTDTFVVLEYTKSS